MTEQRQDAKIAVFCYYIIHYILQATTFGFHSSTGIKTDMKTLQIFFTIFSLVEITKSTFFYCNDVKKTNSDPLMEIDIAFLKGDCEVRRTCEPG